MIRWCSTLLALSLASACASKESDADGDGFVSLQDCDDADASVNPDADETCDGVDQDCDGTIDEDVAGASSWFVDGDGDGIGGVDPVVACDEPAGAVADGTDCDDTDVNVHPGASERCDGADDDCDGDIDEDPIDGTSFYVDGDGDGFGAGAPAAEACEPTDGLSAYDADCDDTDASVFPGADEDCDGEDDDCDGLVDDDVENGGLTLYADADGDGYGDPAVTSEACGGADGYVDDATDCDDADATVHPGAPERCLTAGVDDDCDGETDEDDAVDPSSFWADADGDGYGGDAIYVEGCTAPDGYVATSADCDDTNAATHPGAAELCNGADDDCDLGTGEAGTAAFTDATGAVSDWTTTLAGSYRAPAVVKLSDPGTLSLCEGTWYVDLSVEADVTIEGQPGDPAVVVLDGGGDSAVVAVETEGLSVAIADVTLTDGAGTETLFGSGYPAGGGLSCVSTGAPTAIVLDSVAITGNAAVYAGGLMGYNCDISGTDTVVDANTVTGIGAGAVSFGGTLDLVGGSVSDNVSTDDGGGIVYYDVDGLGVSGSLEDVEVDGNSATDAAGGLAVLGGTVSVLGSRGSGVGFTGNHDAQGGAGVWLEDGGSVTFDTVDFGTSRGGDDNDPADIYCQTTGYTYLYGDDETFDCDDALCGTETTYTLGSTGYTQALTDAFVGNAALATSDGTIDSFEVYLSNGDTTDCTGTLYVLSAGTTADPAWDVEWSGTATAPASTRGWVSSGEVGVPVVTGRIYALVEAFSCSAGYFYYDYNGGSTNDVGMGTTDGIWYDGASNASAYGSTVTAGWYGNSSRVYMNIAVSH